MYAHPRKTRSLAAAAATAAPKRVKVPTPPANAASPHRKRKESGGEPGAASQPPSKRLKTVVGILNKVAAEQGELPLRALRQPESPQPSTPLAKIIPDPAAGATASVLRSNESDHALRLLIEEKVLRDPKLMALPERTRRMVITIRAETERKKLKAQRIRERRALREWNSFKHRLEREDLPADRHLHGPVMPRAKRVRAGRATRGRQPKRQRREEQEGEASDIGEVLQRWEGSAVVEDAGKLPESPTVGVRVRVPTKGAVREPAASAELPVIPSSPAAETEEEPTVAASKDEKPRKRKLLGSFKARIRTWEQEMIAKKIERYRGRRERAMKLKNETLAAIEQQREEEAKQPKKRARKGVKATARKLLAELSQEAATKCERIDEKIVELDEELAALEELAAKLRRK
ncbi:hypothetical protein TWF696_000679 [Orbilia brochopaga]|uniref:Uncharacterized protein n=1 Tax=Orbilia brochopaga TaxID=3140254 RepID=A0AAV9VEC5_9PEZI